MYFVDFESFQKVSKGSTAFAVVVERLIGDKIQSSPIPIECLSDVLTSIEEVSSGVPMCLWHADSKQVVVIPTNQIAGIRLVYQK